MNLRPLDPQFAGRLVDWTTQTLSRELEIVRKDPDQRGFQVQSKCWAVERTFSWLLAHRRLARDYEAGPARSETMIRWAMIGIMVRRLTRLSGCSGVKNFAAGLRRNARDPSRPLALLGLA